MAYSSFIGRLALGFGGWTWGTVTSCFDFCFASDCVVFAFAATGFAGVDGCLAGALLCALAAGLAGAADLVAGFALEAGALGVFPPFDLCTF